MDRPPFDPVRAAFLLVAGSPRRAAFVILGLPPVVINVP